MTGECTRDSELPLILLRKICSAECVSHLNGLLGEEGVWSGMDGIGLLCCWLCNGADDRMQTGKLKELCGEERCGIKRSNSTSGTARRWLLLCLTAPLTPEHDSLVFVRNAIPAAGRARGGECLATNGMFKFE